MRIAELRRERGLRQVDLADAVGVHRNAVSRWEKGIAFPRAGHIIDATVIVVEHYRQRWK